MNFTKDCWSSGHSPTIAFHIPVLCLATVSMNLVSMATFIRFPNLRQNNNNLLIFSMSIADLMVAIVTGSISAVLVTHNSTSFAISGYIAGPICVAIMISGMNLIVMTLDRLIAVIYPLKYNIIVRRERLIKIIFVIWIIPSLIGIISTILSTTVTSIHLLYVVSNIVLTSMLLILIISNAILFRSSLNASNKVNFKPSIRTLVRESTNMLQKGPNELTSGKVQRSRRRKRDGGRILQRNSNVVYPSLQDSQNVNGPKHEINERYEEENKNTTAYPSLNGQKNSFDDEKIPKAVGKMSRCVKKKVSKNGEYDTEKLKYDSKRTILNNACRKKHRDDNNEHISHERGNLPKEYSHLAKSSETRDMFMLATMAFAQRSSSCTESFPKPNNRLPPLRSRASTTSCPRESKLGNRRVTAPPTQSVVQRWRRKYMKTKQKSCYMCLVFTITYTSCILPVNVYLFGIVAHGWCPTVKAFQILSLLIILNSLVNPMLYFFKRKDFRKHISKLMPSIKSRKETEKKES